VREAEAMKWSSGVSGSDCLLDCLRAVRLDRFAGNFATRGVTDCGKLAAIERHQFATYGITAPTHVQRLAKLVAVIREVLAEGHVCRHFVAAESSNWTLSGQRSPQKR